MKLYLINGANLNLLGVREPELYGRETYASLCDRVKTYCTEKGIDLVIFQSNHEGDLVDKIQEAYFDHADGIILNPGAYTHTSVALRDAITGTGIRTVEVHVTDPDAREEFRRVNFIRGVCAATVKGHGTDGYLEAVDFFLGKNQK